MEPMDFEGVAPENDLGRTLRREIFRKGLRRFAFFSLAGLGALVYATTTPATLAALQHLNFAYFILALLRFVLYFSPTPGGSGVGEISIAALMSVFMPTHLLPVYTILYRAFHLYLPGAFGAWVLLSELREARGVPAASQGMK